MYVYSWSELQAVSVHVTEGMIIWKAIVGVSCNLQRIVIILQHVVDINQ